MKLKKVVLFCLIAVSSINVFAQAKKKSPIDGRIYTISLIEQDKKKPEPIADEASFTAGKFKSNYLIQAGFMAIEYEYDVDSSSGTAQIKFTVEAKNDSQERFSWEGVIDGDNVTGTAIIRKKGKIQHTYNFKGTQKNKKKAPKAKPQPKTPAKPAADSTKSE